MANDRDLNRTRARITRAALAEFAAKGFAGARTDAIARRARVNEGMIFYCFKTKEGLYREVMRERMAEAVRMIESNPAYDFASNLVQGYANVCANHDGIRLWVWEALEPSRGRLVAERERRDLFRAQIGQLRRARVRDGLPREIDDQTMLVVSAALRLAPLVFPQLVRLVTGLGPEDPKFRRKWSKCLRWLGERIAQPSGVNGRAGLRNVPSPNHLAPIPAR
ncbi:MAG TPA: TetR/AcrR family transcriptional regulator [Candidatus Binataceae bacterium]|nr:TetR/AcrR family transcriptional regulator [Candidatus Binataceae bacterium]